MTIVRIVLAVLLVIIAVGCALPANDTDFLQKEALEIIRYRERKGLLPNGFDEVSNSFKVSRASPSGGVVQYFKCGREAFVLLSTGRNKIFEAGLGDDAAVYVIQGKFKSRNDFAALLPNEVEEPALSVIMETLKMSREERRQ